ncbi:amidohydrolase [Parashewanella spongiae]|uniref:Amidohydrolase n=2 Tax=Parashewanella spongiae TaxID=342950 RepID=A0A3A6U233_9GAMM|nr:amidohydrolase [Parashewanella spongiae]
MLACYVLILPSIGYANDHLDQKYLNILSSVEQQLPDLESLYLHLHQHPELSYQEKATGELLAKKLKQLGFEVTKNIGGYGVVGQLNNGDGPTIMIRTDTDALPVVEQTGKRYASKVKTHDADNNLVGVMHACGHDLHMTSFIGTATFLAQNRKEWKGTLMMVAQPAEEVGGGAKALLKDGLFKNYPIPDHIIALHTHANLAAGTVGIATGYTMANVDSVDIKVKGIGGHGAYPNKTIDPIVLASRIVLALQTITSREISPIESSVITVGAIQGGSKRNVIGDEVILKLTVRSYKPEVRQKQLDAIKRIASGIASSAGLKRPLLPEVIVYNDETAPALFNDPNQTHKVKQSLVNVLGSQNVIKAVPSMVGEDFARYGLTVDKKPITMFWLGGVEPKQYKQSKKTGKALPTLHSSEFAPDYPLAIKTGVTAMTTSVLDLFNQ